MLSRRRAPLEFLSISAIDIFASALGAFMLLTILMMPYWLRQPSLREAQAGAEAELAAAGMALEEADRIAAEALAQSQEAESGLAEAQAAHAAALAELQAAQARAAARVPGDDLAPPTPPQPLPPRAGAIRIRDLDLVFVMDTTGSMRPALADVQSSLLGIVRILARLAPSLRVGFVAYRDRGEAYVTRETPLLRVNQGNVTALLAFVQGLDAQGGGDDPEAVEAGLDVALAMPWRPDADGRIIVIGDAPVHPARVGQTLSMAAGFAASGTRLPRSVSVIYTGTDARVGDYFARLAEAGRGDFNQYQGQMIENVLLAVLDPDGGRR